MKIIGEAGYGTFIAEISSEEIRKAQNLAYGKLPSISIGAVIDMGAGYDFRNEIRGLTTDFLGSENRFARASDTLTNLALLLAEEKQHDHE